MLAISEGIHIKFCLILFFQGQDSVPDTVHHVIVPVDPRNDSSWSNLKRAIQTDGVHQRDRVGPGVNSDEAWSEAIKILKGEYCIR